jgi:hypothetical protein
MSTVVENPKPEVLDALDFQYYLATLYMILGRYAECGKPPFGEYQEQSKYSRVGSSLDVQISSLSRTHIPWLTTTLHEGRKALFANCGDQ